VKEIMILAGPNGAGKTTAARKLLPKFPGIKEFLNADELARAISPKSLSRWLSLRGAVCWRMCGSLLR
jgi:predicted ABC-type ATPase